MLNNGIYLAPVANLSVTVKGTISFRCEKPKEIRSDKSFEMSRIPSHFHIKIHKRSRIGFLNNSYIFLSSYRCQEILIGVEEIRRMMNLTWFSIDRWNGETKKKMRIYRWIYKDVKGGKVINHRHKEYERARFIFYFSNVVVSAIRNEGILTCEDRFRLISPAYQLHEYSREFIDLSAAVSAWPVFFFSL